MGKARKIFTMSEDGKHEYCCNAVKIGTVKPIEGSDFLGQTLVNGVSIVVRKDMVKEGDLMFYASNECALNKGFLGTNNLFELSSCELNSNYDDIKTDIEKAKQYKENANEMLKTASKNKKRLIKVLDKVGELSSDREEIQKKLDTFEKMSENSFLLKDKANGIMDSLKGKCGFFNKHGRVRLIRLKGCPSYGFLFTKEEMAKFKPAVADIDMMDMFDEINGELIGWDFDTVDDELFVKAYVPEVKTHTQRNTNKKVDKADKFDRMVDGEFKFHYETSQLGKNMYLLTPDTPITISLKIHGTSAIFANIKTKKPIYLPWYKKVYNWAIKSLRMSKKWLYDDYYVDYDNVYSSRRVIKNQYINKKASDGGYYGTDVWAEYNELLKPYIPKGMTIYGEIFGYCTNDENKMIQRNYDYGCKPGENKFMIYRITTDLDGNKYDWNVIDVYEWTKNLISEHAELAKKLHPIDILYHGTLSYLYPDVDKQQHWHENILERLKTDVSHFNMERKEPLCINDVPREGIVIRIDNDPINEAFKLKTDMFYEHERKNIDNGVVDTEMEEEYVE